MALVKVLLFSAVILALVSFGARTTRMELRISHNDLLHEQALGVAQAGINDVFTRLTADPNFDTALVFSGATWSSFNQDDGNGYKFVPFPAGSSDGYHVRVLDNADDGDPTHDSDHLVHIRAIGTVGGAERIVDAIVAKNPAWGCPVRC